MRAFERICTFDDPRGTVDKPEDDLYHESEGKKFKKKLDVPHCNALLLRPRSRIFAVTESTAEQRELLCHDEHAPVPHDVVPVSCRVVPCLTKEVAQRIRLALSHIALIMHRSFPSFRILLLKNYALLISKAFLVSKVDNSLTSFENQICSADDRCQ